MPKLPVKKWNFFRANDPIPTKAKPVAGVIRTEETLVRKKEGAAGEEPLFSHINYYIAFEYEVEIDVSEEEFQARKNEGF